MHSSPEQPASTPTSRIWDIFSRGQVDPLDAAVGEKARQAAQALLSPSDRPGALWGTPLVASVSGHRSAPASDTQRVLRPPGGPDTATGVATPTGPDDQRMALAFFPALAVLCGFGFVLWFLPQNSPLGPAGRPGVSREAAPSPISAPSTAGPDAGSADGAAGAGIEKPAGPNGTERATGPAESASGDEAEILAAVREYIGTYGERDADKHCALLARDWSNRSYWDGKWSRPSNRRRGCKWLKTIHHDTMTVRPIGRIKIETLHTDAHGNPQAKATFTQYFCGVSSNYTYSSVGIQDLYLRKLDGSWKFYQGEYVGTQRQTNKGCLPAPGE